MTITKDAYKYWQSGGTQGSLMGGSKNTVAQTPATSAAGAPTQTFMTPSTAFPQYSSGSWAGLPTGTWGPTGQPLSPPPATPTPGTAPPPPSGGSQGGILGGTTVPHPIQGHPMQGHPHIRSYADWQQSHPGQGILGQNGAGGGSNIFGLLAQLLGQHNGN